MATHFNYLQYNVLSVARIMVGAVGDGVEREGIVMQQADCWMFGRWGGGGGSQFTLNPMT